MNLLNKIKSVLNKYDSRAGIELPPLVKFGHVATNLTFFQPNIDIDNVIRDLKKNGILIKKYEKQGKFLNLFLDFDVLQEEKLFYKHNSNQLINLEYLSPNPTGPLHLGHFRNICVGNSIYNLLKLVGMRVETEMYINDIGSQIDKFMLALNHYKNPTQYEAVDYKNEYTENIAKEIVQVKREDVIKLILSKIQSTLFRMNIQFDRITLESDITKSSAEVLEKMRDRVYEGTLENQKSEGILTILKTNDDDHKVLFRSNGRPTYFMNDIAYFYEKSLRSNEMICVLGEDHIGHLTALKNALAPLTDKTIRIVKYGIVTADGQVMSKRQGNIIELDKLSFSEINRITCEIMKQNFDKPADIKSNNNINMSYYIQYVYECTNEYIQNNNDDDLIIEDELAEDLFRLLVHYPLVVEKSVENLNTHRLFDFSYNIIMRAYEYIKNTEIKKSSILMLKIFAVTNIMINVFNLFINHAETDEEEKEINEMMENFYHTHSKSSTEN
jgi:arginyl-tRNA synthetase